MVNATSALYRRFLARQDPRAAAAAAAEATAEGRGARTGVDEGMEGVGAATEGVPSAELYAREALLRLAAHPRCGPLDSLCRLLVSLSSVAIMPMLLPL